jgi:hypothetical protein
VSDAFEVYSAGTFPGLRAPTPLTRRLKEQGCLMSFKKKEDVKLKEGRDVALSPRQTKYRHTYAENRKASGVRKGKYQSRKYTYTDESGDSSQPEEGQDVRLDTAQPALETNTSRQGDATMVSLGGSPFSVSNHLSEATSPNSRTPPADAAVMMTSWGEPSGGSTASEVSEMSEDSFWFESEEITWLLPVERQAIGDIVSAYCARRPTLCTVRGSGCNVVSEPAEDPEGTENTTTMTSASQYSGGSHGNDSSVSGRIVPQDPTATTTRKR